jgi:hypothetical protein
LHHGPSFAFIDTPILLEILGGENGRIPSNSGGRPQLSAGFAAANDQT